MHKTVLSAVAFIVMGSSLFAIDSVELVTNPMDEVVVESDSSLHTVGFKIGTLGLGLDFYIPVNESLNVRFNVNGLSYSREDSEKNVNYDVSIDLLTVGLLLDYYLVPEGQFHLTAGVYYNGNSFNGKAIPTARTYEINDVVYQADKIGTLEIETILGKVAPYAGIGWGNKGSEAGWGFSLDVGAMYHGEAEFEASVTRGVDIPADGGLNDTFFNQIQSNVEAERQIIEDEINDYKWYPVVMIGINYTF